MKLLVLALLVALASAQGEELDVLTLKNGRVLEGHYDALTKAFTFGGGIVGSAQIEPGDIVKREKKVIADLPAAGDASAPAPAGGATAPPTSAPGAAGGDPVQAKRAAAAANLKHSQVQKDLKNSEDYQRLYETNIAKMEAEQLDLPQKIKALQPRIDRARTDLDNAQSRYTNAQTEYDWWNGQHYRTGVYGGASVSDARLQRDRAQLALKSLQDDEAKSQRRLDQLSKDLVGERSKLQNSLDKQAKLKEELAKLDAAPAPAP